MNKLCSGGRAERSACSSIANQGQTEIPGCEDSGAGKTNQELSPKGPHHPKEPVPAHLALSIW